MRRPRCGRWHRRSAARRCDAGCGRPTDAAARACRGRAAGRAHAGVGEAGCGSCSLTSSSLLPNGAGGLTGLAELATHAFALVADAFALVGFRRPQGAYLGCDLPDLLFVRAADVDLGRALDLDVDAGGRLEHDRMREPERQVE